MKWNFDYQESFEKAMKIIDGEVVDENTISLENKIEDIIAYLKEIRVANINELSKLLTLANNCAEALGGELLVEVEKEICISLIVEKIYVEADSIINPAEDFLNCVMDSYKYLDFSAHKGKILIKIVTI